MSGFCAELPYRFERISLAQGLAQSHITAMVQGPSGYLWVGTQHGLDRFDGYRFTSWEPGEGPESLSDGYVRDLMFDRDGQLWITTLRGMNRLDPDSGRVRQYFPASANSGSTPFQLYPQDSLISDERGNVLALADSGPVRWDRVTDHLEFLKVDDPPEQFRFGRLLHDRDGELWLALPARLWIYNQEHERFLPRLSLGTVALDGPIAIMRERVVAHPETGIVWVTDAGLLHVKSDSQQPPHRIQASDPALSNAVVDAIEIDSGGDWWIHAANRLIRVDQRNPRHWQPVLDTSGMRSTVTGARRLSVAITRDGRRWIGGNFGVAVIEPGSDRAQLIKHHPANMHSLPPSLGHEGYRLMTDRFGTLWIGTTLGGLARRAPQADRFRHLLNTAPQSRSLNVVQAVAEQKVGEHEWVWTINQAAGVSVWQRDPTGQYSIIHEYRAGLGHLPDNNVRAIAMAPDHETVWLSGDGWLGWSRRPGDSLELERTGIYIPSALMFDQVGHLWVASEVPGRGGIYEFRVDPSGRPERIRQWNPESNPEIEDMGFITFCSLSTDRIVAAGWGGIVLIDRESGQLRRLLPGGEPVWSPGNQVFSVACTARDRVWFGTQHGGLGEMRLDEEDQPSFRFLTREDGLADNTVYAVLPEREDFLWISSNRGVQRVDPVNRKVDQFGLRDGLQEYEYNRNVAHIGASGNFYFGGVNGLNVFRPESIKLFPEPPVVHLSSMQVNEDSVDPTGLNDPLHLPHDQNRIEFEFVGLQFTGPAHIRYAHRLSGIDPDWITNGNERRARYSSLPPGHYRFEVRAASPDGIWSAPAQLAAFTIRRPPWNTPWAWAGYALLLMLATWSLIQRHRSRERALQALVDQRTSELRDALEARTTLFANISHEFRTPLTLIGASLDELDDGERSDAVARARRYLLRLLRLVEQLLDLSRLKSGRPLANRSPWRLDLLVSHTVHAFESVARERDIALEVHIDGSWQTSCSADLVEKILLNLLTNAIKYTPAGERVEVLLDSHGRGACLTVQDTGPGIPSEQQQVIFERFYRAERSESGVENGTGIGLAIVREAVDLLGGSLSLDSEVGKGSTFRVNLPASRVEDEAVSAPEPPESARRELDLEVLARPVHAEQDRDRNVGSSERQGTVLIVEDNDDLRRWIADSLAARWQVIEAVNGQQGLALARKHGPDLVISDLMMPVMDGFELLQALRDDIETSHIPVLMLTARQDDQTRLRAFRLSADEFLSKPFRIAEVAARLDQMLNSRERLQQHLQQKLRGPEGATPTAGPTGPANPADDPMAEEAASMRLEGELSLRDQELLRRVETWLERNFSDPEANIEDMADAALLSGRTLQRKLKALTGQSPARMLRNQRLRASRQQLLEMDSTITEIAHRCGFSSAQYFSRIFRQAHGQSPNQWRRAHSSPL